MRGRQDKMKWTPGISWAGLMILLSMHLCGKLFGRCTKRHPQYTNIHRFIATRYIQASKSCRKNHWPSVHTENIFIIIYDAIRTVRRWHHFERSTLIPIFSRTDGDRSFRKWFGYAVHAECMRTAWTAHAPCETQRWQHCINWHVRKFCPVIQAIKTKTQNEKRRVKTGWL